MEFSKELTLTAFLAVILCFVIAKVVTFAVAEKETLSGGGGISKGKKRVKFSDEVVIKRVDRYEDIGLDDDDYFGGEICNEKCFDMREMHSFDVMDKGSVEIEDTCCDGGNKMDVGFVENETILEVSGMRSLCLEEEEKCKEVLESGDIMIDQNEGNGLVGYKENEGITAENSFIDTLMSTEECKSCYISSDVDPKQVCHSQDSFMDSREDDGLITKNHTIDSVLKNKESGSCHIGSVDDVPMWHGLKPFPVSGENEGIIAGDVEEEDEGTVKDECVECEDDDDDDWEGIERSELEKVFAEAVNYVEYGVKDDADRLAKFGSDVQMQLYGLHKVAVEGPCHEPQPMALKLSARAKWNAWQSLGSTSQEVAMEQYIRILQDSIPGWMNNNYSTGADIQSSLKLESVEKISTPGYDRKLELNAAIDDSSIGLSSGEKQGHS